MEPTPAQYTFRKPLIFRNTLSEGYLPFSDVKPSLKELTQEDLKSSKNPDTSTLSEANVIRSFKGKAAPVFNKGKLVYHQPTNEWWKILDLKTDEGYKPTWASLAKKDGSDSKEIKSNFEEYSNELKIFININKEGEDTITIEVNPKIYEKFETVLEGPFEGAGVQLMAYKLFFNGQTIEKEQNLSNIEGVKDGDCIFASEGFGKPFVYNRFPDVNNSWGWSNSGGSADGIMFKPNQNIKVCGFSTFAARQKDSYELKYRVRINGADVEEETVNATGWEDEYYYRHTLKGVYSAPAGSKIEFTCWIAESLASNSYVETYSGQNGQNYKEIDNEHMGLFEIDSGGDSVNGTSVYSGHFPEIFYFLG